MATNDAVNVGLSGSTGTGNFAGSTSPTFVTPIIGAATATSLAFSPTTGGVVGTTAADNAGAGKVGEVISSVIVSGSAVTFSNGVNKDLTSITISAGDWNIYSNIQFTGTTTTGMAAWTSTSSATFPDGSLVVEITGLATATTIGSVVPYARYNVSGSTIVYLSGNVSGTGTLKGQGGIYARRVR